MENTGCATESSPPFKDSQYGHLFLVLSVHYYEILHKRVQINHCTSVDWANYLRKSIYQPS